MNFLDVDSWAEAEMLASQPVLLSQEEDRRHRRVQQRLAVAKADERSMGVWKRNHLEDVDYENNSWAQKEAKAAREVKRKRKAFVEAQYASPSTLDSDDDRWLDVLETMDEDSNSGNDLSDWD
jgi:hypothetical protein